MTMLGTFVSVWDNGVIRTPAILDETSGSVDTESIEADGMEHLMEEWFESGDEEYDICPVCHEYILKTVMKDGIGSCLDEVRVCSDPDCENQ